MFKFTVQADVSKLTDKITKDFAPGGAVQNLWDETVFTGSVPYMPMVTGTLINLSRASTVMGSGELIYPGPHSHYLWEGVLYVDPVYGKGAFYDPVYGFWSRPGITKVPSEKELEFNKESNPDAGPRWVERAANDNMPTWIESLKDEIRKR